MGRTPMVGESGPAPRRGRPHPPKLWRGFAAVLLAAVSGVTVGVPTPRAQTDADSLRIQLGDLAYTEGIAISGLARVGDAAPREERGKTLYSRLRSLLLGYNYLLVHDSSGAIEAVRIMGVERARPVQPRRFYVPAMRRGDHHEIDAILTGPGGMWQALRLLLDTGASTIVLPASAIEPLGFAEEDLSDVAAATAGGEVPARTGRLASVTVGNAVAADVAVTFIDDERFQGPPLLGMSFLNQFDLAIDDAAGQIILTAKDSGLIPSASP